MKMQQKSEKIEAICESCSKLVTTTTDRRTIPFSDNAGEVKDILVDVCSECDEVVAIPPKSLPEINQEYQRIYREQEKVCNPN